jgi:hypothetical protein
VCGYGVRGVTGGLVRVLKADDALRGAAPTLAHALLMGQAPSNPSLARSSRCASRVPREWQLGRLGQGLDCMRRTHGHEGNGGEDAATVVCRETDCQVRSVGLARAQHWRAT